MTKLARSLAALSALVLIGACGSDDPAIDTSTTTAADETDAGTDVTDGETPDDGEQPIEFIAELTGAAERPGPGDSDGEGRASITLQTDTNEICFIIEVDDIADASAAHIHGGGPDIAGPIVVELTAPAPSSDGCTAAEAELVNDLVQNPADYYFNVHNAGSPPAR